MQVIKIFQKKEFIISTSHVPVIFKHMLRKTEEQRWQLKEQYIYLVLNSLLIKIQRMTKHNAIKQVMSSSNLTLKSNTFI